MIFYLIKKLISYNFVYFKNTFLFYIPKQFRKKLYNSALPSIFIEYDSNPPDYKIYEFCNNKIIFISLFRIFSRIFLGTSPLLRLF